MNEGFYWVMAIACFCLLIFGIIYASTSYYQNLSEHKTCLNTCSSSYMNGEQKLDCIKSCNEKCGDNTLNKAEKEGWAIWK